MKIFKHIITILTTIVISLSATVSGADRYPVVAGAFYPDDSLGLYKMVDTLLQKNQPDEKIDGTTLAIISPHAGFVYSGPTAACGYNVLAEMKNLETVIIIGFKHQVDYRGAAIWTEGSWVTPLGKVPVNSDLASKILNKNITKSTISSFSSAFINNEATFAGEHSLETQIPFLQVACPDISIVPIQIGAQGDKIINELVNVLTSVLKDEKNYVLIASTDLSHYHSHKDCLKIDSKTASYIKDMDGDGLWQASSSGKAELCGAAPSAVVLQVAKNLGADNVRILKQTDSGEFSGDNSRVVGYISAVAYKSDNKIDASIEPKSKEQYLTDQEHATLLEIARKSIESYVNNTPLPSFDITDGKLKDMGAAFVTINKNHQLRGCIGYTEAIMPLYQTVSTCAIKAAAEDPRFPKLTKTEYDDIELEISVLTPLKKIDDVSVIEVDKHGLLLQKGNRRGLLLPQVATDYGWDRETFLDQTCRKAGMSIGCWKDNCEIYIFTAEVFGED
jgi:MEMO1 family protein